MYCVQIKVNLGNLFHISTLSREGLISFPFIIFNVESKACSPRVFAISFAVFEAAFAIFFAVFEVAAFAISFAVFEVAAFARLDPSLLASGLIRFIRPREKPPISFPFCWISPPLILIV